MILRSTVSVGTTRNTVLPYLSELCGKSQDDLLVGMCPERTVEGKAVEELRTLPQVISGNNQKALEKAEELFSHITKRIIEAESLEEAELIKLYNNTYRDMTFAIGNAFCIAAQTFGVDGTSVIRHANEGYDRSDIKLPGFVAGPCLEKDAYLLTNNMVDCDSKDFVLMGRKINETLEDQVVNWVERHVEKHGLEKSVVLSGMAFKGVPETSDLRGSSSVYIARKLHKLGYKLTLHDYVAKKEEMEALKVGDVCDNLIEAVNKCEIVLILNNHVEYANLSGDGFGEKDCWVLDSWDICCSLKRENIHIETLGTMNL